MIDITYYPEPGQEVTWTSQAVGSERTKTGTVIAAVPAGKSVRKLVPPDTKRSHIKYDRDVSIYDRILVAVPDGKDGQITHYYAPRASVVAREDYGKSN